MTNSENKLDVWEIVARECYCAFNQSVWSMDLPWEELSKRSQLGWIEASKQAVRVYEALDFEVGDVENLFCEPDITELYDEIDEIKFIGRGEGWESLFDEGDTNIAGSID